MKVLQKDSANRNPSALSKVYDALLTIVYPQPCKICSKSIENRFYGNICAICWRKTKIFDGNEILCSKCGAFLKDGIPQFETFCHRCDDDFYDKAKAVGLYEKALLFSLLDLKKIPYIPQKLRDLFLNGFEDSDFQDATLIIPTPLSKKRLAERGFNQSLLLAQIIARQTNLSIADKILMRKSHISKHRAGMDRKSRYESVEDAFEILSPQLIKDQKILLVDDVFTSGATVSNCARILKQNGADKIYVLTVARAY